MNHAALSCCRGLTLRESATLAALLAHPDPRTTALRLPAPPLQQALQQALQHNITAQDLLPRLAQAPDEGLRACHPTWHQHWGANAQQASSYAHDIIEELKKNTTSPLDPRHRHEQDLGEVLEPEQLRLADPLDIETLCLHLGATLLARALHTMPPRDKARLVRSLPPALQTTFTQTSPPKPHNLLDAIASAPTRRASRAPSIPQGLFKLGTWALAMMGAHRRADTTRGLAHALPTAHGISLLRAMAQAPSGPHVENFAHTVTKLILRTLQQLSERALTQSHWATRRILLTPHTTRATP